MRASLSRRSRLPRLRRREAEDGVILVFWALSLTALVGFLAIVLNIGNLLQSSDNVQNAADAAAITGAGTVGSILTSAEQSAPTDPIIPIPSSDGCKVVGRGDNQLLGCATLNWLNQYYIFENQGWLQIVVGQPQTGQISEHRAFFFGAQLGPWTCSMISQGNCTQLSTNLPSSPLQDDALTTISAMQTTTQGAAAQVSGQVETLVQQDYGVSANWSGCGASSLPSGFTFAAGETCVAFCTPSSANCGGSQSNVFWVMVVTPSPPSLLSAGGSTCTTRVAWANADGLVSEAPTAPTSCP